MRVAVDLRCLLEPFESGVTVYTKAMVDEFLQCPELELDLFYQTRRPFNKIHESYPQARWIPYSSTRFHVQSLWDSLPLPKNYFPLQPDLIWLPDRRPFYKTKIPVVMTVHDQVPERERGSLSLKSRVWHRLFSLRRLERFCAGFLFPSLTVAYSVYTALPWEVTYEGAKLVSGEEKPKELPSGASDFVLSLAPLDPRKRLNWVFEMAHAFPKTMFVCAGIKLHDSRFSSFTLPKFPNLFYLSSFTEQEKSWLLRYAKVLLAVSMDEGFDLPVLEAVKAKTPVILSDIPVHQELYKNAIFVKDLNGLRAALYSALEGHGKVPIPRGRYDWEKAAQRALLFFGRVLLHKDRQGGRHGHSHDHAHNA